MSKIIAPATFFAFLYILSLSGEAKAQIFVYKDSQGVLHFTNAPNHAGYRRLAREWNKGSPSSQVDPGRFEEIIRSASDRHRVDADLVRAVIKVESDFNSQARSHKGAQGLMQLMPETARLHNVRDSYDPDENIDGGVRHLRLLLDRYQGDLRLALAGYNAGIKAVEKYGGIPPYPETKEYIRRVLDYHQYYRGNGTTSLTEQARQ